MHFIVFFLETHPPQAVRGRCRFIKIKIAETYAKIKKIPGDQEGLFKLAVQLRIFFNSVIYNTATGYVLLVYLTNT
jgi:hypothetical protein